MSGQSSLGNLERAGRPARLLAAARWLLPIGWCLAALGYWGPWIAHPTSALAVSGVDMAEFVKFLPGMLDDSLRLTRQWFYLPPLAVTVSIGLLINSRNLEYPKAVRALGMLLAVPVSLQLLPPAWSPSSLLTPEFRAQTFALIASWLLLVASWLLGRLPALLLSSVGAALSLVALLLPVWQFLVAKPAIDEVYVVPPSTGWGIFTCAVGLALTAAASAFLILTTRSHTKARQRGS